MTDAQAVPATARPDGWPDDETRRGARFLSFAGALLVVSGIFKIFDAIWAFKYDDEIAEDVQTIVFERDPSSWGWVWLVVGVVLIAAGVAVGTGAEWARWTGIIAAALAAITFLPWIYVAPFWAILSVALALTVIFALTVYGGSWVRMRSTGRGRTT